MNKHYLHDVLIIGSGAAGLSVALRLPKELKIAVLAKDNLAEGATLYAQGGVAAVMAEDDSLSSHIEDTITAGAGLCNHETVAFTVQHAKQCIEWLVAQGVDFSQEALPNGHVNYHLTREGGHSHRRVLHAADATGHVIETTLVDVIKKRPNIELFEKHIAVDLIKNADRCVGAYVLNDNDQRVHVFQARCVVLATGGASRVYLYTSNPDVACGDGLAMAWRAGCPIANMEFNQFHPTCLYHPEARSFLITEAMRGEGAKLTLPNGECFMPRFDGRAELAPRDVVARAIDHEMKRLGIACVYLDIRHKPAAFIKEHFPTIYQRCLELGIDITTQRIPVVPAAHYTCGGIVTDFAGRTQLPQLYAVGEVAFTGLHGANRMASNSLLECLVFGMSAAADIIKQIEYMPLPSPAPEWDESRVTDSDEVIVVTHNWAELRRCMWDYVGIVRTTKRLQRAHNRIKLLQNEIQEYYRHFKVTKDLLELRNLVVVADLIVRSALSRKESRGLHYTLDYPVLDSVNPPQNTVLYPQAER